MKPKADNGPGCIEAGILENALVMIAVLGKNGKVLAWNHAAETITGYARDDVVGNTGVWKKMYPEKQYRNNVTRRIAGILAEKNFFEGLETTITTRTGGKKTILWNTKETQTQSGPVVVAVGQDITQLRELDAFRTSVAENANVLIAVLGKKGEVLLWNRAAEEITGYSREEAAGPGDIWKRLYPDPEYRKKITGQITGIIAENEFFENLETTITTKGGDTRIISWNTRQISGEDGGHSIAIGRDITEQKKAEEALIAYMSEMAMRIRQPVGIIRDNLKDIARLTRDKKVSGDEIAMLLDAQIRNATQVEANVQEFQKAVLEKNREIPDAYRKFLGG
ncbi:PAS domain S-box protein [Methanoregula sp. PtaB.Bin085]|uniref:PAS domain-containing protein n=1 Tax=Methanoregula sp. PtaB.Bin085 TaxID=1811680 RepID=UPI0009D44365|nr:PAS domain S-box protein [Methanoregula sp. PtaB.Bin085]OPX64447.1 MAG: RNase II stability modulator [Methanoregula sp. PtaB.Bin085]